jgi:hypothetical protein
MGYMRGTILSQYLEQVVNRGAQAVLPQHLEARWLELLLDEAQSFQDGNGDFAGLCASVMAILGHQHAAGWERGETIEIETDRLLKCLGYYAICLAMEEVSRKTDIRGEPPTLDNIFDETRDIPFTRTD